MTFRAFIAVEVEVGTKLEEFWNKLKESNAQLKLVEPENIHLTLKFLGDTDEAKIGDIESAMSLSIEGVEPFTMEMIGTGAFPNPNYMKVIWVGLEGADSLVKIAKALNSELSKHGFKREKKGFRPHVTLARVKGPRNKQILGDILKEYQDVVFGTQKVEGIKLKKSVLSREGPTYITVKEVKLLGT
ncbi:MAG: RNA 2',3'-cyclic phosphodiesterase [Thermoplasmata archaeon]|nr:MAG: RNA 2',3'-cyclic phosphodiesterase [Thermoplasmata archaeon]